jgi:Fur family transcriptional regulator, ferric uptake regulator
LQISGIILKKEGRDHMTTKETSDSTGKKQDAIRDLQLQTLAENQLRDAEVRITPARIKVLTALLGACCAFSHQDMQDTLVEMDRVTLYRALDCLTDAGLAHKISGDDRIFRYSAGNEHRDDGNTAAQMVRPAQNQHGHFKCTRCARIFCLDNSTQAGLLPPILQQQWQHTLQTTLGTGFQSHEIELTIKGWCADCAH